MSKVVVSRGNHICAQCHNMIRYKEKYFYTNSKKRVCMKCHTNEFVENVKKGKKKKMKKSKYEFISNN